MLIVDNLNYSKSSSRKILTYYWLLLAPKEDSCRLGKIKSMAPNQSQDLLIELNNHNGSLGRNEQICPKA